MTLTKQRRVTHRDFVPDYRVATWLLFMGGVLLIAVCVGLAVATKDLPPCWPDCRP